MEIDEIKAILEALIFAADHPLSIDRMAGVLEGIEKPSIREALELLIKDYASRNGGIYIEKVAGGYQLRTRPAFAVWIKRLFKSGTQKVSKASMEALSIIAYKQPVTRAELETLRGVDSGGVLKTLMDKRLIKIVGRKETPGRPAVYGTTKEFLEAFDLKDLSNLPTLVDTRLYDETEETNDTRETTQDNSGVGFDVEAQGRVDDNRGTGEAQRQDRDRDGDEGGPSA